MQTETQLSISPRQILSCLQTGQLDPSPDQKLQQLWSNLKITIGGLIIKGYRTFKYMLDQQCIIFVKREQYNTNYLFFKLCGQGEGSKFFKGLGECIGVVEGFRGRKLEGFGVVLLWGLEDVVVEVKGTEEVRAVLDKLGNTQSSNNNEQPSTGTKTNIDRKQFLQLLPAQSYTLQCYKQTASPEQTNLSPNPEQHNKLKQIIYSYIDTFGQKYKTAYYPQLTKKSLYLINTINLLIFEQTKPSRKPSEPTPVYNQIESACWTAFKTGKLESDRKDIVLTGGGGILFLDLVFQGFGRHVDGVYKEEVQELLKECAKAYSEGKLKVVKIENNLTSRHVYNYHSKLINSFNRLPAYT